MISCSAPGYRSSWPFDQPAIRRCTGGTSTTFSAVPKAQITGNVHYKALEMHQGAVIAGQLFPTAVLVEEKPPLKLASNNP